MAVKVEEPKCTGCGDCVDACPCEALKIEDGKSKVSANDCSDCGACVDSCSQGALSLD